MTAGVEVTTTAADGWQLGGSLHLPDGTAPRAGVVTVPGALHERDAWTSTAAALVERGVACLLLDIRGRGTSHGAVPYAAMGPGVRRRVRLDVAAAIDLLADRLTADADPSVGATPLGVIGEQDTAAATTEAAAGDTRVRALCLVSPRGDHRVARALTGSTLAFFGITSAEDRPGVRTAVDAFLAVNESPANRIDVHHGLGIGITMAAVRQFERPDEPRLETDIADWTTGALTGTA